MTTAPTLDAGLTMPFLQEGMLEEKTASNSLVPWLSGAETFEVVS